MLRFIRSEDGATSIEYAIIGTAIAVGIMAVLWTIGDKLIAAFTKMGDWKRS